MKNSSLENRLKKLAWMIPEKKTKLLFDVSKLATDELVFLSDTLKSIRSQEMKTTQYDVSKLTNDDLTQLSKILERIAYNEKL